MKIKLNPDQEIVNTIREGLKRTGGYCPCRRERTEATKCMCQEFKDQIADPGVKAKLFCPEIAGLFCRIAGLFCHDSRANLSLKPVCFGIAIS